jgi:hypothetical protein
MLHVRILLETPELGNGTEAPVLIFRSIMRAHFSPLLFLAFVDWMSWGWILEPSIPDCGSFADNFGLQGYIPMNDSSTLTLLNSALLCQTTKSRPILLRKKPRAET